MKNIRLISFQIIFLLINLAFIPLISLYGLRSCPVLSIPGFGFGCYYSGIFIFLVNTLNILSLAFLKGFASRIIGKFNYLNNSLILFCIYLASTGLALTFLNQLLHSQHLSSESRAPEILLFASLLLGVLQSYGMTWAGYTILPAVNPRQKKFRQRWIEHVVRTLCPFAIVIAVTLHFIMSQSVGFNEGHTAPLAEHDDFIRQISYLLVFLTSWLLVTLLFHFLSEKDQVNKIQNHFQKLKDLELSYSTDVTYSWGLWLAITDQLNIFTKTLNEKTRLVKSFSKFVSVGIVQQVLKNENLQRGITRELTVMMADIRDFTSIAAALSPDQVVTLLNEYFSVMLNVLSKYNITVDKFIGDGLLAYAEQEQGLPNSGVENSNAIEAALEMLQALKELNPKLTALGLPELKMGIGIYRGPLVIGLIGSEDKLQHTIIGDTVNRTARLESLCKEFDVSVITTMEVWQTINPAAQNQLLSLGKAHVKGINTPLDVFGAKV